VQEPRASQDDDVESASPGWACANLDFYAAPIGYWGCFVFALGKRWLVLRLTRSGRCCRRPILLLGACWGSR